MDKSKFLITNAILRASCSTMWDKFLFALYNISGVRVWGRGHITENLLSMIVDENSKKKKILKILIINQRKAFRFFLVCYWEIFPGAPSTGVCWLQFEKQEFSG